jgi:hypothetical protein
MIPLNQEKTTANRSLSEFNESLSLLLSEINEIGNAYLDLTKIADNTLTSKAESFLLSELNRLSSQLRFKTDNLDSHLTIVKPD